MGICPKHGIERNKNYQCKECRREYGRTQAKKDSDKKYRDSEKGKAAELRYRNSEKGKLTKQRCSSTEKARERNKLHNKKYYHSKRGEIVRYKYKMSGKRLAVTRKYQTSEKAKITQKKRSSTPEGKQRLRARDCVNRAILYGRLIRSPCIICNNPKVEAHHAWGYSEEHRLHVVFLCKKHHIMADKNPLFNEEVKEKAPYGAKDLLVSKIILE